LLKGVGHFGANYLVEGYVNSIVLSQSTRVTDGQTEGQN